MLKLSILFFLIAEQLMSANWDVVPGFPFNPASITITAGDTVSWSSLGSSHNVAETNVLGAGAAYNGGFYSGAAFGGPSTLVITPGVGNYLYFCEVHGGTNMWGHIHVLPPPTATATVTPTNTETFTESPTFTNSPTPTESPTQSPTHTISETFTSGPSPTFSVTRTDSPTGTVTPTVSPTPSFSPTPSASPSRSVTFTTTPKFKRSPHDRVMLGPVPVKAGNPLCLAFPAAPFRTLCELYNSRGELVIREKFETQISRCIDTKTLAPGLYFANIEEEDKDQKHQSRRQKIVVLP